MSNTFFRVQKCSKRSVISQKLYFGRTELLQAERETARKILGDVKTPALSIEIGAVFQGNSFMFDTENPPTFSMTKMSPVPKQKPVNDKD